MTPANVVHWFFRNIGWKLLSLGLATLVWIAVYREPEMTSIIAAPVQYKNIPANLEISSDIVGDVDLETRGPAGLLRNLSEKRLAVVLDFSGVNEPCERTFTIDRSNTSLPRGVDLIRITPAQLRFTFERRIARKVPVELRLSGPLPAGMKATPDPPQLAITGPESKVRKVTSLITDPADLQSLLDGKTVRVSAYLPNSQVRFQGSPEVTVRLSVANKPKIHE